jgi:hypothetical protein
MPQASLIQNSFNSGEISPLAIGRSDTAPYKNALGKCRNFIPTPVGPLVKRPCTRYVTPISDETKTSRLINFSFSNVASYILEFADQEIRFFTPSGEGGWLLPPTITFDDQRIDLTLDTIGLADAHYFQDGAGPFRLTTEGTLPGPLATDTDYYIVLAANSAGAASFGLSTTKGGAAENLINAGGAGETHTLTPQPSVIQAIDSPYLESELFELDFVPSGDILYITHRNHAPRQLERRTANGFRLREIFFKEGPWEEINLKIALTLDPSQPVATTQAEPNTFLPADVAISGSTDDPVDRIIIPNHGYVDLDGPVELKTTDTLPAPLAVETGYWIVYVDENTFQLAATAGGAVIPLTSRGAGVHTIEGRSDDAMVASGDVFNTDSPSKDIGRRVRWRTAIDSDGQPNWTWGIIDSVSDAKNCATQVHRTQGTGVATSVFRLGAFYPGNYPAFCGIHEQRLWFASTPAFPNTLWASQIGDFTNFAPDEGIGDYNDEARVVTDASGINFTLGAGQVDKFSFIAAVRQMIVGTTGAIWPIQASSNLEPLSPVNINARPSAIVGSAVVKPVLVSDEIVYLSASSHKMLAIGFEFERDAFVPQNLSVLADHFTEERIIQLAYSQEPHSVVWACRSDGLLVGITYERTQRVLGWHGHHLGGIDSKVLSIANVVDDTQAYDQLWMIVERTINGQTRRYIEFMEEPFYTNSDLEDAAYLDSSIQPYEGSPTTQITGLDHLEAEMVFALADGSWHGPLQVVGGTITLPTEASKVRVGLNYFAYAQILPFETERAPGGSIVGVAKRLIESLVRVHRSNYIKVGKELDSMIEVDTREITDEPEQPVPLRTKDFSILTAHGASIDQSFFVGSDKPVPLDIVGIIGRLEWSQR